MSNLRAWPPVLDPGVPHDDSSEFFEGFPRNPSLGKNVRQLSLCIDVNHPKMSSKNLMPDEMEPKIDMPRALVELMVLDEMLSSFIIFIDNSWGINCKPQTAEEVAHEQYIFGAFCCRHILCLHGAGGREVLTSRGPGNSCVVEHE